MEHTTQSTLVLPGVGGVDVVPAEASAEEVASRLRCLVAAAAGDVPAPPPPSR